MRLRDVDFGNVLTASGTLNFYGEGYPYQKLLKPFGCNFTGAGLVAKTVTIQKRKGNMSLNQDGSLPLFPLKPACIVVNREKGIALNAVGLSNLGAVAHLESGKWQKLEEPFSLSFMAVGQSKEERLHELRAFVILLGVYLPWFQEPVCLQLNYSCPNTGHEVGELASEVEEGLNIASALDIPLIPKFNVELPVQMALEISRHPACDGICISNTIPWGKLPERIDWVGLFGSMTSPLAHLGGGGLSGAPLLPLVAEWVYAARTTGITKPINAGGGILEPKDVDVLLDAGATSVFLGSISFLRPFSVRDTILYAEQSFKRRGRSQTWR
ncbi:hypothetical protein A3C91_03065 [Candidatus Azambacteria bacterium RIFCSPHIGHO2_02_FULL_52_12]|uniref:Dihydroorotate dehydrogenase catalytic domain-containing protein n=1 Tax=Candidatus Azambacteria bacterium RIFCSPLOWO2_01_FULL_46_25 TaxID=1797298 RepID=A0A1F5BTC2_9BACT|nr:MAG: hypothetical protein A3C91_03065 [Candidatus Azambacteria bacterium RIFCSPHIGHO2_02_FULL_52_12]OGD33814.1 MAG: hypothetical protein A2988_01930 [Candidatus Azambacteria bacterium RIFCSPLOWO2_01_FULL_46_25]OGD37567.1 MAG: hypothetical protein A2850_04005 [Candidatus Azambacteria bacterium RIFCSPHIGHO2_01_FULL_51_74]